MTQPADSVKAAVADELEIRCGSKAVVINWGSPARRCVDCREEHAYPTQRNETPVFREPFLPPIAVQEPLPIRLPDFRVPP